MKNFGYYGFTKEEYDSCKHLRDKANLKNVTMICCISGFLELTLGIAAFFVSVVGNYGIWYVTYGILTLSLLFLARRRFGQIPTEWIVYAFMTLAFSCGILLSIPSKEEKAILFLVLLVLLPLLFLDNAWRMIAYLLAVSICYGIVAFHTKNPRVAQLDLYNIFCFGGLGILTQYFLNRQMLAGYISRVENEQLLKDYEKAQCELRRQAHTDLMTGLYNRTYFLKKVTDFLDNDARPNDTLYLTILDLDKFKSINDKLGHQKGDQTIIAVANVIQKHLEAQEFSTRLGGDEFMFLLCDRFHTTSPAAVIEDIMADIRNIQIHADWNASASMGVTIFRQPSGCFEELYSSSDHLLYQAKKTGGNQIVQKNFSALQQQTK